MTIETVERMKKIEASKALECADSETVTAAVAARMIMCGEYPETHNNGYRKLYARQICDRAEWLVAYYMYSHGKTILDKAALYEELYQKSLELKQLRDKDHLSYFIIIRDKKGKPYIVDSPYMTVKMHFPLKKGTINKYGYASAEQAGYALWRMQERIRVGKLNKMLPEVAEGQMEIYHLKDTDRSDVDSKK